WHHVSTYVRNFCTEVTASSFKCVKFGNPYYALTLIKWYNEIESDEGEEAAEDSVQNDDSSSEIDMDEGNE
ncbi:hypothetical protein HHI36_008344, partial [Cryptolaemus montrouzieri]